MCNSKKKKWAKNINSQFTKEKEKEMINTYLKNPRFTSNESH